MYDDDYDNDNDDVDKEKIEKKEKEEEEKKKRLSVFFLVYKRDETRANTVSQLDRMSCVHTYEMIYRNVHQCIYVPENNIALSGVNIIETKVI